MVTVPLLYPSSDESSAPTRTTFNRLDLPPDSALTEIVATANYDTNKHIRTAIHDLKYKKRLEAASKMGGRLLATFRALNWPISLIVAVPLHPARLRERGFNQAALLAEIIAAGTDIPFHRETLRRVANTPSQLKQRGTARMTNVARAFVAEPDLADAQTVLLIDDVCTTGATMNACAHALVSAGARAVYGLAVAGVPEGVGRAPEPRHACIRLVKAKGLRYVQLVFPDGRSKSLGAFNPTNPAGLCDHALEVVCGDDLPLEEVTALRDANKAFRPVNITARDLALPYRFTFAGETEQPARDVVKPEHRCAAPSPISLLSPTEPHTLEGLLTTARRILPAPPESPNTLYDERQAERPDQSKGEATARLAETVPAQGMVGVTGGSDRPAAAHGIQGVTGRSRSEKLPTGTTARSKSGKRAARSLWGRLWGFVRRLTGRA